MTLSLVVAVSMATLASDSKKTSSTPAPAKPAAPAAKPAAPPAHAATGTGASTAHTATGAVGTSAGTATGHPGPTTGHPGPTANGPTTTHSGLTTNTATANHTGTTTGNPGSKITTTTPAPKGPQSPTSVEKRTNMGHPAGPGPGHAQNAGINGRPAPKGAQIAHTSTGNVVQRRPGGGISDVHDDKRGMDIHHNLNGGRRVEVERADHSRIVAERGRGGYIQHGYRYRGREYDRRSYYYHGRAYNRYYNRYSYYGRPVYVYAPVRYYSAAFYGWAYNPWYQPVYFSWGWAGNPWYGYYGYYFAPAPVYPTASVWLADYLISQDLANAYQARQENQSSSEPVNAENGAGPITPEVRQQIADEVKNQIALENAEGVQNSSNQDPDPASSGIARMLTDGNPHVFVVGGALDAVDASTSTECALSDGDALQLVTPPPAGATEANVVVLSSKGGKECRKGTTVTLAVNDLQDMQNHMRDLIDQGLQELQAKQGTGSYPALSPSAKAPPVEPGYAQAAPPADPKGAEEIAQQLAEADQAEEAVVNEVQQQAPPSAPAPSANVSGTQGPPPTIEIGQNTKQVEAELGSPIKVIDLGVKKTYIYKDIKVIFTNGKVSDVQ